MQKLYLFVFLFAVMILPSCKTTNYKYFPPTVNPVLFHNKSEVHVLGEISSSGLTAKGAVSVTDHIAVMGMYNSGIYTYQSREGEAAAGYYTRNLYVSGGMGYGSNFAYTDTTQKTKLYEGNFYRPFVQLNTGVDGGKIAGGLKGDAVFCLKSSYLFYDGKYLNAKNDGIHSQYFVLEPALMLGLGSRVFHFDLLLGFPMHFAANPLSSYSNARTFPVNAGFGIRFVFGRHKDEEAKK